MSREIPLSRGLVALVSDIDYPRVSQYRWCADGNGYAVRMESFYAEGKRQRRKLMLHRFILNAPPHLQVDHINHDVLDNRRENMRLVTVAQNRANSRPKSGGSSRYKGVHWHKRDEKWCAMIRVDGVKYHLGTFESEAEAGRAYDVAARKYWGPLAYQNFPEHVFSFARVRTVSSQTCLGNSSTA